jgi:AcrR family transcriptional regulator
MAVKGDSGHGRRTQAERSATTRAALLAAARTLFAERGFAGTGREEIVERAGVTRGAMYHHFASKEDLFREVYVQIEDELTAAIATAAMASADPMEQLRLGSIAFLDAAARPDVRRVVLLDAPSVLPVPVRRELSERHGLGLVREALLAVMATGRIERRPVEPLARVVMAALHEAATMVADGADRAEVGAEVERMLEKL